MEKIIGITANGVKLTLGEWKAEHAHQYDAEGWMDVFGHLIGSGTAAMPDGTWVDLSQFAILRVEE